MLCGSFLAEVLLQLLWQKKKKYIYKMCFLIMIGNIHNSLYFHFENNVL